MRYSEKIIKRLFARSQNRCAMPDCSGPIVIGDTVVGEICHIRAKNKKGPRFDASLSPSARNEYDNLLLLCRTCHKLVDSKTNIYTINMLSRIKSIQDREGGLELDANGQKNARLLFESLSPRRKVSAAARDHGIAIAVGGDNFGSIHVTSSVSRKSKASRYPPNSIGADANLCGYIDYLFGLGVDYWKGVEKMSPGRLGKMIKKRFRLKQKTRNHLSVDRFEEMAAFIISDILEPSPVGKRHRRQGTKLCRTFSEYRSGSLS